MKIAIGCDHGGYELKQEIIAYLKKDVAIWNINSFGEFYMQIEEKYKKSYASSLEKLRQERKRFQSELEKIKGIRVIPSQANYVMVELLEMADSERKLTAKNLTKVMLLKYNILIKDLSNKIKDRQFLRLAIRNTEDNDRLLEALRREIR